MEVSTGEVVNISARYLGKPWYSLVIRKLAESCDASMYMCKYTLFETNVKTITFPTAINNGVGANELVRKALAKAQLKIMNEVIRDAVKGEDTTD